MELEIQCIDYLELEFVHELIQDVIEVFLFGFIVLLLNFTVCVDRYMHSHSFFVALQTFEDVIGHLLRE